MDTAPRLALTAISKSYSDGAVLDGLDLSIAAGEVVAVCGGSGTGKSTMLNISGLLDRPDQGGVHILGHDTGRYSARRRAQMRARHLGFVFQGFHLLEEFDVCENVLIPLRASGGDLAGGRRHAGELLERVGLAHRLHARPTTLSGGEAQRVALCRALINKPQLVLADEPTGNLDPATAALVLQLLLDLARDNNAGVLLVTHAPTIAAAADRQLTLSCGRLHSAEAADV
ncbi:MAG: ABC transporter ATP-binding protein [Planctomycetota bacterium]|jgi:lipoprotein-releasing system ATP-binding protein